MSAFRRQLRWELRKLWRRPRTYAGFVATFLFELTLMLFWRLPAVREGYGRELFHLDVDVDRALTGLTTAVHVTAECMALIGALFLGLVASDMLAREVEDGTLRMALARPVGRTSLLAQKLVASAVYTVALTAFVGLSTLALGLVLEGPGKLVVFSVREGVVAVLGFGLGLERYALAVPMLAAAMFTVTLLAIAVSCFPMKSGTAIVVAGSILLADHLIRLEPALGSIAPYTLTTRLLTWRQMFGHPINWGRIERNYRDLLMLDLVLIAISWWAFTRREITR